MEYIFKTGQTGLQTTLLVFRLIKGTSLTASFIPDYQVVTIGENRLLIDKTNIPDGDNFKLITQVVSSTGNVRLYFENVIDWNNNPVESQTKLIKWSGTNDSLKIPLWLNQTTR